MSSRNGKRVSHEAREQRNREILAMHKRGASAGDICDKTGVSYSMLGHVLLSLGISRLAITFENRKKAAVLCDSGEHRKVVAKRFGRSVEWVRCACIEHGVNPPRVRRSGSTGRILLVIADLQNNPADTYQAIADRHKIKRQRVHQMLVEAIACGFRFPGRKLPAVKPQSADTETQR